MKLFKNIIIFSMLSSLQVDAKRPPKTPKPPKQPKISKPLSSEQKQVIVASAAQVVNGVFMIAQNPHNKQTVGSSIAQMLNAIINIIAERMSNRGIQNNNPALIDDCINQICHEINKEINTIIALKKE